MRKTEMINTRLEPKLKKSFRGYIRPFGGFYF